MASEQAASSSRNGAGKGQELLHHSSSATRLLIAQPHLRQSSKVPSALQALRAAALPQPQLFPPQRRRPARLPPQRRRPAREITSTVMLAGLVAAVIATTVVSGVGLATNPLDGAAPMPLVAANQTTVLPRPIRRRLPGRPRPLRKHGVNAVVSSGKAPRSALTGACARSRMITTPSVRQPPDKM